MDRVALAPGVLSRGLCVRVGHMGQGGQSKMDRSGRGNSGRGGPGHVVVSVDPGLDKCGVAVVLDTGEPLLRAVVPTPELFAYLHGIAERWPRADLVLGDRTGSQDVYASLQQDGSPWRGRVFLVNEHGSSVEGRKRYLAENPGRGWQRLLPAGLRSPDRPFDDYVAQILAERFLATREKQKE